jgi:ATP-binding cassette, subfamily C, bacterial
LIDLLEPDSGAITVGDVPLRGAATIRWRDHVSYVVQDPYLFRDTIRRNLLWANPQAGDAEIWDALAIAGVDDFVADLTAGLDTVLGERGTLISGGERQRLCLARAVLRRRSSSCSTKQPARSTFRRNGKSSRQCSISSRARQW